MKIDIFLFTNTIISAMEAASKTIKWLAPLVLIKFNFEAMVYNLLII